MKIYLIEFVISGTNELKKIIGGYKKEEDIKPYILKNYGHCSYLRISKG
jgi:hypothetical protein